jgi:hypothetical protein
MRFMLRPYCTRRAEGAEIRAWLHGIYVFYVRAFNVLQSKRKSALDLRYLKRNIVCLAKASNISDCVHWPCRATRRAENNITEFCGLREQ